VSDLMLYSREKEKNRHAVLLLIPGNSSLFLFQKGEKLGEGENHKSKYT
jgi:hypothetical protein